MPQSVMSLSTLGCICLILLIYVSCCHGEELGAVRQNVHPPTVSRSNSRTQKGGSCYKGDLVCEKDKLGYEAISTLHNQMDDDHNGDIDLEESAEFLLEELQYSKSQWSEDRSKKFHMNDTHITVDDLWTLWKNSSVHNWTVEQVASWLTYDVELPQYVETFRINVVDGCTLPRLAVNNLNFVSNILGIKNLVHKQKLANKATDVVLFGPPKSRHNWYKDVALVLVSIMAAGGLWFAYRQHKRLEITMARTLEDMDSLARSEVALKELQAKLEREELEKHRHIQHKEQLEEKIKYEISEARLEAQKLKLTKEQTETQLSRMKETHVELERTREALLVVQKELDVRNSLTPTIELQKWLQITFELELKAYNEKKNLAEQQLLNAKDSCEKLRRKKQALFGSLRMAHSGYIDETEHMIVSAKNALEEVKHDLAERQYRWQQIENMCQFSIISNTGIKALILSTGHTELYKFCHGGALLEATTSTDIDDLEDMPPTYGAVVAGTTPGRAGSAARNITKGSKGISTVSSIGDGSSSRAGSEEPQSVGSVQPVEDAKSTDVGSVVTAVSNDSDDSNGVAQPKFMLDSEDHDSSSTSSNENNASSIPAVSKLRPPLQKRVALCQATDAMSVCSEKIDPSSSSVEEPMMRSRSRTDESLATYKNNRVKAVSSPLTTTNGASTSANIISSKNCTLTQMKRSYTTTDSHLNKLRINKLSSTSTHDSLKAPGSAPASLILSQGNESDTSLSSGSKDEDSIHRKKTKKKNPLFHLFKTKPQTS